MAQYKGSYAATDIEVNEAFPQGCRVYRAIVFVTVEHGGNIVKDFPCLVDTGADYCQFPEYLISDLGIEESELKHASIDALVVSSALVPFASLTLTVQDFKPSPIRAGFSKELNKHKAGILGHGGCLDRFQIFLDPQNGFFVLGDYEDS
jgi:hypothetical protein